jgi:hypothetical protein
MTADAENADGLTLPTTNVASSEQQGLTIWYVRISNKRSRVKERSFNLPLLVNPNGRISRIRLSSGKSHSRKQNCHIHDSARFGFKQLFDNLHDLARWRFRLLFSAAYLSGILLSDCSYHAVHLFFIQIRTPLLGQVYPSIQSPPIPCGTGSVFHQPVLHRYYGFIRPLLTHWSGFPIQVIPRLPILLQLSSLTQKRVGY